MKCRSHAVLAPYAVVLGLLLVACSHDRPAVRIPAGAPTAVISLVDIDCQSCGAAVTNVLEQQPGVLAARFDRDRAEVTVTYDPALTEPAALLEAVRGVGYTAELGAGAGRYVAEVSFDEGADVVWISRAGEDVELARYVVPGKVTVFDFYATWCGPCREVDAEMKLVLAASPEVALRKLDVVSWETPVAAHYLAGVAGLPYVVVYGRDGKQVRAISGLDLPALRAAIAQGLGR